MLPYKELKKQSHSKRKTLQPWILAVIVFLILSCIIKLTLFWSVMRHLLNRNAAEENLPGIPAGEKTDMEYRVVCYYTIKRNGSELDPSLVDPYLCTHIIVGFAQIVNNTLEPSDTYDINLYQSILSLKQINPNLKVMLSVMELSTDGCGFKNIISSSYLRNRFAKESLALTRKLGFDGLDLDWEFPSWPKEEPGERTNFTLLVEAFREEIDGTRGQDLLSIAVASPKTILLQAYNIPWLAKYVDFVSVMSYDYHSYSRLLPLTGPNSPLYPRPAETGLMATLNTNWSAQYWAFAGMPRSKINLGIPTYGHSFTLMNEDNSGWGAPALGVGHLGQGGFVSWIEACRFVSNPLTTHVFDEDYNVPYAYSNTEWLSYENLQSVTIKAEYIKDNMFGGAMVFSLPDDDFKGVCGGESFSLTRAVSNSLRSAPPIYSKK